MYRHRPVLKSVPAVLVGGFPLVKGQAAALGCGDKNRDRGVPRVLALKAVKCRYIVAYPN